MLTRLIFDPAAELRRATNQMGNGSSLQQHFRRGNANREQLVTLRILGVCPRRPIDPNSGGIGFERNRCSAQQVTERGAARALPVFQQLD
jgi:hypothetical protein